MMVLLGRCYEMAKELPLSRTSLMFDLLLLYIPSSTILVMRLPLNTQPVSVLSVGRNSSWDFQQGAK